jgi:hypothetical protein
VDCLLARPGSEDKWPKRPPFNGPKFLCSGPSVRLQGARKKLRVMRLRLSQDLYFLFINPLPESEL